MNQLVEDTILQLPIPKSLNYKQEKEEQRCQNAKELFDKITTKLKKQMNEPSEKGYIRVHSDLLFYYPEFAKALIDKGFLVYRTSRRILSWGYDLEKNTIIKFDLDKKIESDDDQTDLEYDV